MAQFKMSGDIVDYTPAAAVEGGDVKVLGNDLLAVVISDIAADETGSVYIRGVMEMPTASSSLEVGDNAFWSGTAITATDTDVYAGRCTTDADGSVVQVSINFKHEVTGS